MRNILPIFLFLASCVASSSMQAECVDSTDNGIGMKAWWFFGYEKTTPDGITADVQAFKDAGFTGVVYYDQNHAQGNNGAEDGFTEEWWNNLKFAGKEANRLGLSFEVNVSNGYVAGGKWIDPEHAMQRVASASIVIEGGKKVDIDLPEIIGKDGYVKDIAVLALPIKDEDSMRHISASYKASGKGRSGAMQEPGRHKTFSGAKFTALPDIGVLQVSDDSTTWRDVVSIQHMYSSQGGYPIRTNAFPATRGKYWRINYFGDIRLKEWSIGSEAKADRWEELAALHSDFIDTDNTPAYKQEEVIAVNDIIDLSGVVDGQHLTWNAPKGKWRVIRLAATLTGAKSKHGRPNLLGYECDKLSREASLLHWNSYAQIIIDTLRANDIDVVGVTMDSHEGGSQNWTPKMLYEFKARRGYDLLPYLPVLAGFVVESKEQTLNVLRDLRHTINDCMTDNYYVVLQEQATANGLTFTAQAIGNALCITGDAISVKRGLDKPQGEFWAYQQNGAYDVKDCSSAAHLYGKPIASAEAMTDAVYTDSLLSLKRVADIAFAMGAQEFVICATPHIPVVNPTEPYIAGREYAINRSNPKWESLKPLWQTLNRTMRILQQGKAAPDVLIYLGDDAPVKTLTHKLPGDIDGLDWDVCTGHALKTRLSPTAEGKLSTPDGITYNAIIIEDSIYISPESRIILEDFRKAGVHVLSHGKDVKRQIFVNSKDIVSCHRIIEGKDVFFLANISDKETTTNIQFATNPSAVEILHLGNGTKETLQMNQAGQFPIHFTEGESIICCITALCN